MSIKLRISSLLLLLIALGVRVELLADFGDPGGYLRNDSVTETVLYPGVKLYKVGGTESGTPQVIHVVSVDLTTPNVSLQALSGQRFVGNTQYYRRSQVSQMHADNDALVTINTSFFDIGSTMAPSGLQIQNGMMLREPTTSRNLFALTQENRAVITSGLGMSAVVATYNGAEQRLTGMNRNAIANGQIVAYQQPWERSPGTTAAFTGDLAITEVVLKKLGFRAASNFRDVSRITARAVSVRNNQGSVTIGNDEIVLTAAGSSRAFLQNMTPGSIVDIEWKLTGLPSGLDWSTITQATAGSNRLIKDGAIQFGNSSHWNARHPRSAAGISADGSKLLLVMVEGRSAGRAEGLSLHILARYLRHLGAYQGVEFDGGGSSGLAARVNGVNKLVNTPSGSSERYVPAGLGVMVHPETPHPFFGNIQITPGGESALISWKTALPAKTHVIFGSEDYSRQSIPSPDPRNSHSQLLTGLNPSGVTYFRLVAETSTGTIISHGMEIVSEIIMDDPEARLIGNWATGSYPTPWGASYRHVATVVGNPTHTATFSPDLQVSGIYDVFTWYVHGTNRPTEARYEILHDVELTEFEVNQTTNGSQWRLLARNLSFTAGENAFLRITNSSSPQGKYVMVDGVKFVLKQPAPQPAGTPPVWWSSHFFGTEPPEPNEDKDGDGLSLWEEFLWTTNPTDSTSRPRVALEPKSDGGWKLSFFPYHEGRSYQVQAQKSLSDARWADPFLAGPVIDENSWGVFQVPSSYPFQFFRILVKEK